MIKHKPTLKVHFIDISDPRIQRKLLHKLSDIFFITLCAVICGGDSWVVIKKPYCQFFTLPGLTATQGLFNIGKHKKDETIIVTGAACFCTSAPGTPLILFVYRILTLNAVPMNSVSCTNKEFIASN